MSLNNLFIQYCSIYNNCKSQEFNDKLNKLAKLYEIKETHTQNNLQFHSEYGILQQDKNETFQELRQLFFDKLEEHLQKVEEIPFELFNDNCEDPKSKGHTLKDIKSWCLVQRENAYAAIHTHYNINYTLVYYSKVLNAPSPQGYLEVVDPNLFNSFGRHKQESFYIKPEVGMLVILPGYIPHMTHPIFVKEQERISWVCDFVNHEIF